MIDTVIMGNARLYEIKNEKDALYAKEDFTDEDGIRASELSGICRDERLGSGVRRGTAPERPGN